MLKTFGLFTGKQMDASIMGRLRHVITEENVAELLRYSKEDYGTINLGQIANSVADEKGKGFDMTPYKRFTMDLVKSCLPDSYELSFAKQKMRYRDDEFSEGVIYVAKTERGKAMKKVIMAETSRNSIPQSLAKTF